MKKIMLMLLVVLMSLSACAKEPKPEDALKTFLDDYISLETMEFADYIKGDSPLSNGSVLGTEDLSEELTARIMDIYKHYTYTIGDVTISEDKTTATVKVLLTNFDGSTLYEDWMTTYITKAMELAFTNPDMTQEDFEALALETFSDTLDALVDGKEYNVEVKMVKDEKVWKLVGGEENYELINAMSGGILDSIKNLNTPD